MQTIQLEWGFKIINTEGFNNLKNYIFKDANISNHLSLIFCTITPFPFKIGRPTNCSLDVFIYEPKKTRRF